MPMSLLTARQFMIDPGHEVANPLQPGPHRPVPLAGKRVWSTARQGSRSFRRAVGKVARRRGDYAAAGRHEAFYVSSARIALSTIQPPQWKRRCVTDRSLMRRAGRPAAVFAYPATRRRAVPDLSARLCRGGRGATARSDGLHHPVRSSARSSPGLPTCWTPGSSGLQLTAFSPCAGADGA